MRSKKWVVGVAATSLAAAMAVPATPAFASSHREAPLIAQDPTVDNTDVYLFRDANDPSRVNIIANYIGLEDPASGPNFPRFADDALYEIHIDNDGDVNDDIVYQFRFRTTVENQNTFLYNTGPITAPNAGAQNVRQFYSLQRTDANGTTMMLNSVNTPPVNVGVRSTPNYHEALAAPTVTQLPGGGQVFAGQRNDPFFVDIGSAFDLLGLRPLNPAHLIPMEASPGINGLQGKNVHTIALSLPITAVSRNGNIPTVEDSKDSFIGVHATSSRQRVRVLSLAGGQPRNLGRWVQVSRLGVPFVNELLIPLGLKDRFNASRPADDAQFLASILDPEPARLIPVLYPGVNTPQGGFAADGTPRRTDLVAVLTGQAAGLSPANALPPADLLRLNLARAADLPGNRLGILAGDPAGFPNGRRLTDDIVDIELRLLAGGTPFTPAFNVFPNNALTDGVDADDFAPLGFFPYVDTPFNGYNSSPQGVSAP